MVNTFMLQTVLEVPEFNELLEPEDRRGLTPLFWTHINPYGRFPLDMNTRLDLGPVSPEPRDRAVGPSGPGGWCSEQGTVGALGDDGQARAMVQLVGGHVVRGPSGVEPVCIFVAEFDDVREREQVLEDRRCLGVAAKENGTEEGAPVERGAGCLSGLCGSCHDGDGVGHAVGLRVDGGHALAQALDVDPVGDVEHVRHAVADQDDGQAAVAQVADQLEDLVRFAHAQGRRRLVQDDDLGPECRWPRGIVR
ncbi:hypothetical protein GCM10023063_45940 [Arthrobacter methylotrophus]